MHCCPLIFILLLITNSVLLCAEGSKVECTKEMKPTDSRFHFCNILAALQLIKPSATSGVGYGNAGYFRTDGVQLTVICQAQFNITLKPISCIGETFISDSSGYTSGRQLVYEHQNTTFVYTSPAEGATVRCNCVTRCMWQEYYDMSCYHSAPYTIPSFEPCNHQQCHANMNSTLCMKKSASSTAIIATWPLHHPENNGMCPSYANLFMKNCTHSVSNPSKMQFFHMGMQPVDSGDAYYLVGNETVILKSPCHLHLFQCYIITGNKSSRRKDFKSKQMIGKSFNTPRCTSWKWEVSEKLFTDLYEDQRTALNIIGCEDNRNNKHLEIYIKLLGDPVLVTDQSSLQCRLDIKDQTVVSSAEAVATGRCVCRFSLAACNPQVSVRQYEHEFQCNTTNMTIPEMSVATNTTDPQQESTSNNMNVDVSEGHDGTVKDTSTGSGQEWISKNENVVMTEGHDGAVQDSSPGLTWLWISIAGVMLLATTVLVIVIVCQKKPNDVTKEHEDEPTKQPPNRKIILDESLFKNSNATPDQSTSPSSHSPILNLVPMEELE